VEARAGENLWATTAFQEEELWYLKPDAALECGAGGDTDSLASTISQAGDQQLVFNINQLIVTVEAGRGNCTIPMLLLESKVSGEVRNWSVGRLSVLTTVQLEVAYYNGKLALWEPVIEPVGYVGPGGHTQHARWSLEVRYSKNSHHDLGSALLSPSFAEDEADGFVCPESLPPLADIGIHSSETLQVTLTKSFLAVLKTLVESFSVTALREMGRREAVMADAFVVVNECGQRVTLLLGEHRHFAFLHAGEAAQLDVAPGARKALNLRFNRHSGQESSSSAMTYISPLANQSDQSEATLKIRVQGQSKEQKPFEVPINKADSRFFKFVFRGDETGEEQGIVSTVSVENGTKFVTLTSILSFKNDYPAAVNIWQETRHRLGVVQRLERDATWHAPVSQVYTEMGRFYFSLAGPDQQMGLSFFSWKEIGRSKGSSQRKTIECTNVYGEPSVFLNIEGTCLEIFHERASQLTRRMYVISIRPSVVLKNCLPIPLYYTSGARAEFRTLEQGEIGCLEDMRHGHTLLRLQLCGWRQVDLSCNKVFDKDMKALEYWRFEASEATASALRLDLGVLREESRGTVVLSIFAPFWIVNKTQRRLHFKGHDGTSEMVHYPEEAALPMMFSFISKSFLGKKKICLRVEDSLWSDPFPVDTIGDTGRIACKLDTRRGSLKTHFRRDKLAEDAFNVGIQISQSTSSFTKIVTFTPYYMIFNDADFDIVLKELEDELVGVTVAAGQCVPFWPVYGGQAVVCQAGGLPGVTVPFSLQQTEPTLLMLSNRAGGIYVKVKTDNSSQSLVSLSGYKAGQAPILLVNATPSWSVQFGERESLNRKYLAPGEKCLFTWERPSGPRALVWAVTNVPGKQYENLLRTDECDVFRVGNGQFAWVSFLDGMQRVLLFTGQPVLARSLAKTTGESERIEQEVDISIFGVGVSVVNNDDGVRRELAYLSVRSSEVVWEVRREGKQRYKSLTTAQCQAIEQDYTVYSRKLAVGKAPLARRQLDQGIIVNYVEERMEAPHRGRLRRQFQKGLWFQMRTSRHQRQFHMKVNHVQLDNQLAECLYPVIAAPVPPPRSVTAVSVPKPFLELSILEYTSPEHNMKQYKYISALVQEMHLKIELGFINALYELLDEEEVLEEDTRAKLEEDLQVARKELREHAVLTFSQENKDFFDYLHLSPLKVHVSLSMTTYNTRRDGAATHRGSNFISLLLQSLGVTIADTNDIIFRLAYFERKHEFFNLDDLTSEISRHYTSQAIKQGYVLLLGFDVLGNPFGLVVGVARSVEDLFYEPFQGAVEGPSEFAEGLAIGVRSVFSGVVGGGAGFVSKITGAVGKGLATLTFDEKFQQKRREGIKRRANQDNLAVGMARNTRDLATGFLGGITGVVTKPVEGARDEGVGGFFKGVGKGVVGLVTRPAGGVVDFASGTLDTVKRATEVNDEFVRSRPARYIHPDGVVRYYDRQEALGARMVRQMDKGRWGLSQITFINLGNTN
jgi:vacuolar protein sorting-associated protein 13A/C